jgi:multiple sugar transport system substrate-binding protein
MALGFGGSAHTKISEFYGAEVAQEVLRGIEAFDRWGFGEGKGALVSKIYGTKVIPEILKRVLDGELDVTQGARLIQEQVSKLEQ